MRSVAEAAAGGAGRAAGAELDEHGGQAGPGLYYKTNKQTERESGSCLLLLLLD